MPTQNESSTATVMTPTQFEEHRQKEIERRAEFRRAFPVVASAIDTNIIRSLPSDIAPENIIKAAGVDEQAEEKINEVNKVHRTMAEVGTIPVTIVNLNPWEIVGAGRWLMYRPIPACPIGQPYVTYLIDHYQIDIEDKGGRFGASPLTPVTIARDLLSQLVPLKRGGLFMYMGDHRPGEYHLEFHCPACGAKRGVGCRDNGVTCAPHPARPKAEEYHKEMKLWDAAKKEQRINMQRLFRYAEQESQQANRSGLKNITEMNRLATQWLVSYRFLEEMPKWMAETRDEAMIPPKCWNCSAEIIGDPCQCLNCGIIVNPAKAYEKGEIEADHHSLRRLSREQLDAIGLKHALTLVEWRAALAAGTVAGESPRAPQPKPTKRGTAPKQADARKVDNSIDPMAHIGDEDPAEKKK